MARCQGHRAEPTRSPVHSRARRGSPNTDRPLFIFDGLPNRLLPGTRISFRNVTCGTDGTTTVCNNSYDGAGFVLGPGGSFVLEPNNPLLLNTGEGKNPYFN